MWHLHLFSKDSLGTGGTPPFSFLFYGHLLLKAGIVQAVQLFHKHRGDREEATSMTWPMNYTAAMNASQPPQVSDSPLVFWGYWSVMQLYTHI